MPLQGFTVVNESAQVACGTCVDLMRAIPDGSVDLVLTDPPYNLGLFMKERGTNMEKLRPNHFAFQGWDDLDFKTWCEQMNQFLAECHRVLKKRGALVIFMSVIKVESIINLAQDNGFYYKTTGIWHKKNPIPRNMNLHFLNSNEPWIYFINEGTTGTFNNDGKPVHDFIETSTISNTEHKKGNHPTQKPVKLLTHFIKLLSNENEVVLDPFMGAGSTGVACMGLKRKFIGIDINQEYVNTSINRIKTEL
jgi:DNA modification methylase